MVNKENNNMTTKRKGYLIVLFYIHCTIMGLEAILTTDIDTKHMEPGYSYKPIKSTIKVGLHTSNMTKRETITHEETTSGIPGINGTQLSDDDILVTMSEIHTKTRYRLNDNGTLDEEITTNSSEYFNNRTMFVTDSKTNRTHLLLNDTKECKDDCLKKVISELGGWSNHMNTSKPDSKSNQVNSTNNTQADYTKIPHRNKSKTETNINNTNKMISNFNFIGNYTDNQVLFGEQEVDMGDPHKKPDSSKPLTKKRTKRCFKESERAYYCTGDCCTGGTYLTCCPNNRPQCHDAVCCYNGICMRGGENVSIDGDLPVLIQISLMDLKKKDEMKKYQQNSYNNSTNDREKPVKFQRKTFRMI